MIALAASILLLAQFVEEPLFERLDNGLRVVFIAERGVPVLSVQLWINAGGDTDPPSSAGLMNLTRGVLEQSAAFQALARSGAWCESRTLADATYFAATVPTELTGMTLERMATLLAERRVSHEEVAAGRRVLSMAHHFDDPNDPLRVVPIAPTSQPTRGADGALTYTAAPNLAGAPLCDGPMDERSAPEQDTAIRALRQDLMEGMSYVRSASVVAPDAITPRDVNDALERWFAAANATLIVVGDASPTELMESVRGTLGSAPWREPPRKPWPAPPGEESLTRGDAATACAVHLGWLLPSYMAFEIAAIDVLMHSLLNTVDGPLRRDLVRVGIEPDWRIVRFRDAGMLLVSLRRLGDAAARDAAWGGQAASVVSRAIEQCADEALEPVRLLRARHLAQRRWLDTQRTIYDRARTVGLCEVIGGDALLYGIEAARRRHVTATDVRAVAGYLMRTRRVVRFAPTSASHVTTSSQSAAPSQPESDVPPKEPDWRSAEFTITALDIPDDAPASMRLSATPLTREIAGVRVHIWPAAAEGRAAIAAGGDWPVLDTPLAEPTRLLFADAGRTADFVSLRGVQPVFERSTAYVAGDARELPAMVELCAARGGIRTSQPMELPLSAEGAFLVGRVKWMREAAIPRKPQPAWLSIAGGTDAGAVLADVEPVLRSMLAGSTSAPAQPDHPPWKSDGSLSRAYYASRAATETEILLWVAGATFAKARPEYRAAFAALAAAPARGAWCTSVQPRWRAAALPGGDLLLRLCASRNPAAELSAMRDRILALRDAPRGEIAAALRIGVVDTLVGCTSAEGMASLDGPGVPLPASRAIDEFAAWLRTADIDAEVIIVAPRAVQAACIDRGFTPAGPDTHAPGGRP